MNFKEELRSRVIMGDVTALDDYREVLLEEELDDFGWNAYHYLAHARRRAVLKFNGAYKLRNKDGKTAVDILLEDSEIDRELLSKMFPWYCPSKDETIEESIKKIRETSAAEQFILSL